MGLLKWRASAVKTLTISATLACVPLGSGALGIELAAWQPTWGSVINFEKKPTVTDVRVGTYFDKTRVVIDVSRPTNLRYDISSNGTAVFIQFPDVEWVASPFEPRHSKGKILEFRYSPEANGGRFNILTDGPVSINKPYMMKPDKKHGHRIVIDLIPNINPDLGLASRVSSKVSENK